MQQEFWPDWADFLSRWKLNPLICELADSAGPVMPVSSQILMLSALLCGVRHSPRQLSAYLQEAAC